MCDRITTNSVWAETKTFFPLFFDYLEKQNKQISVCVIGASDGRFVVPLAKEGYTVVAIESDPTLLNGGIISVGKNKKIEILGLKKRLELENEFKNVKVISKNFLDMKVNFKVDAVFTSSTWDCSINHNRPVKEYIGKMQAIIKPKGIFCAEYMMPCEDKHKKIEHFIDEKQINKYFDKKWKIIDEFYTPVFNDLPHIGKEIEHIHRMGFFLAKNK